MDKRDKELMVRLAKEGKRISDIWEQDFPQYDYWEIYMEVYGSGERSAQGVKRMISNRLKRLLSMPKREQDTVVEEIYELVGHLYERFMQSQKKLDEIRKVINR